MFNTALSFGDVLLLPQYSTISSRQEIDISVSFPQFCRAQVPIIASPMDTVCEEDMCNLLNSHGAIGTIHRYCSIKKQANMYKKGIQSGKQVLCAVGVSGDYLERAAALYDAGARALCIDIAHGHHTLMEDALYKLRQKFDNKCNWIPPESYPSH